MEFLNENIPDSAVRRLSAYLRQLEHLAREGVERVSSQQLASYMKVGAAQVRRDLTLFGQFGRRGVGYEVVDLIEQLRRILGTHVPWNVVVVGAGALSSALARYDGLGRRGFHIVAAFDVDPDKVGDRLGEVEVRAMNELEAQITLHEVRLAILAVPEDAAQAAADRLVEAGIEGILNFAPARLEIPPHVYVNHVDITANLEQLSFQVSNNRP
ncbi:MAG: redox-sensing transcriptional repressor Rex [Planctomycetota bacterium]